MLNMSSSQYLYCFLLLICFIYPYIFLSHLFPSSLTFLAAFVGVLLRFCLVFYLSLAFWLSSSMLPSFNSCFFSLAWSLSLFLLSLLFSELLFSLLMLYSLPFVFLPLVCFFFYSEITFCLHSFYLILLHLGLSKHLFQLPVIHICCGSVYLRPWAYP